MIFNWKTWLQMLPFKKVIFILVALFLIQSVCADRDDDSDESKWIPKWYESNGGVFYKWNDSDEQFTPSFRKLLSQFYFLIYSSLCSEKN